MNKSHFCEDQLVCLLLMTRCSCPALQKFRRLDVRYLTLGKGMVRAF